MSGGSPPSIKERIYRLVEPVKDPTLIEQIVDYFLLAMIAVSILTFIISTVPEVQATHGQLMNRIELFAVIVFTIEYLLRLYTATVNADYQRPIVGRIRYALSPMMLIDLLAILPFYLTFVSGELLVLRILRLFRLARINRYSSALSAVSGAWRKKGPELIIAASMMLSLVLISATLLFYAEQGHHGGERFTSIPDTLWAAIAIVSPLGYDGYYPETVLGKLLMMTIAIFGVAFVALPAGIFSGAFSDQLSEAAQLNRLEQAQAVQPTHLNCPHCGGEIAFEHQPHEG